MERKLIRVARRWGVKEAMAAKTSSKQRNTLREDCLTESTLKIWLEAGGTKRDDDKREKRRRKEERRG